MRRSTPRHKQTGMQRTMNRNSSCVWLTLSPAWSMRIAARILQYQTKKKNYQVLTINTTVLANYTYCGCYYCCYCCTTYDYSYLLHFWLPDARITLFTGIWFCPALLTPPPSRSTPHVGILRCMWEPLVDWTTSLLLLVPPFLFPAAPQLAVSELGKPTPRETKTNISNGTPFLSEKSAIFSSPLSPLHP